MTNVLVLPEIGAGLLNACAYIRLFLPLTKPTATGTLTTRFVAADRLNDDCRADIVISHRAALRTLDEVDRVVRFCRKASAKFVFDLDDDLLALGEDHSDYAQVFPLKPAILKAISMADQVWVSTAALAEVCRAVARDVVVLPNTLDHRVWRSQIPDYSLSTEVIRFMYMGTATHRSDFHALIAPSFVELANEFGSKVRLDVIGVFNDAAHDVPWSISMPPGDRTSTYPAFASWFQSLKGFCVGLAPLCDTAFNRGKSNIKWLEYSALGLATIAADLPPYRAAQHGRDLLLVKPTMNAFLHAMRSLVVDDALRRRLQGRAWAMAAEQLRQSASAVEPRVALLNGLLEERYTMR